MIDFQFLRTGLCGLANAHRAGTMAGHLGAAVVAGYFFGEDQSDLPAQVHRGVEGELRRIIAGEEAIWWNARKAGITPAELFNPMPKEEPQPDRIKTIAEALRKNVGELRESGHNIIFASIAIRALKDHPDEATPSFIDGIRRLVEGFSASHGGKGYYGKGKGWVYAEKVELAYENAFRPYA